MVSAFLLLVKKIILPALKSNEHLLKKYLQPEIKIYRYL